MEKMAPDFLKAPLKSDSIKGKVERNVFGLRLRLRIFQIFPMEFVELKMGQEPPTSDRDRVESLTC